MDALLKVEMAGIEPASEEFSRQTSTSLVDPFCLRSLPRPRSTWVHVVTIRLPP